MSEPFRSLASIFAQRDSAAVPEPAAPELLEIAVAEPVAAIAQLPADERVVDLLDTFVAELARLRARVAERFEEQAEAMLADLARSVLARELATSPLEIEILVAQALADFNGTTGVVVRVCASDAERLGARWPVQAEASLGPGDFAVEIEDGRYDASLQTRLEAMLASHRVAL